LKTRDLLTILMIQIQTTDLRHLSHTVLLGSHETIVRVVWTKWTYESCKMH